MKQHMCSGRNVMAYFKPVNNIMKDGFSVNNTDILGKKEIGVNSTQSQNCDLSITSLNAC